MPNSPYTGIYKSGAHGLARLSNQQLEEVGSFVPQMAVKILLDGRPSVNWHVVHDPFQGQGDDGNFCKNPFSNVLSPPPQKGEPAGHVKAFIETVSSLPGGLKNQPESALNLPVYEHAGVNVNGSDVSGHMIAPYEMIWKPNPAVGWDLENANDYRVNLAEIPSGSLLYTVYARKTKNAKEEKIGKLITESEFASSKYGDEGIFYRHSHKRWQP